MRIAKIIARAGICSRRDAEKLILQARVKFKGEIITNLAAKFDNEENLTVDDKKLQISHTRLWLYNKPKGLITSHKDEKYRKTVFDNLPKNLVRVISVGRLDYNTEGLLLLTNDGELARKFELPSSKILRSYKVRVFGNLDRQIIEKIEKGLTIDGIRYKVEKISQETDNKKNNWYNISLMEGKNREIRKIFEYFGLQVNRLIRISYGPYILGNLRPGEIKEINY